MRSIVLEKRNWQRAVLPALISFAAFSVQLDVLRVEGSWGKVFFLNLIGSFRGFSILNALELPCLLLLYCFIMSIAGEPKKRDWTVIIPSVLFSLFMVFGYSFTKDNTWNLVMQVNNGQFLKAAFVFAGYYILFESLLRLLYYAADNYLLSMPDKLSDGNSRTYLPGKRIGLLTRYMTSLEEHPFRTVFLTLMIAYIPYYIVSYPSKFMGDTGSQIVQAFSELKSSGMAYLPNSRLLSDSVFLNQHHPVFHTLLLHGFLLLGVGLFQSFNAGSFLFALFQSFCLISAISFAVKALLRGHDIAPKYAIAVLAYCFIHPVVHAYMFVVTKDVLYAASFLFLTTNLYMLLKGKNTGKTDIGITIGCVCMLMFRNDSQYILPFGFALIALIHRPVRKRALVLAGFTSIFGVLVFHFLFPAFGITSGSKREMLSVPFQQTARYVRYHANEVTAEEKKAINAVLKYKKLKKRYNPNISDPVKSTYNEKASAGELLEYFRVWFQMFLKHPGVYIQATMNNYYQFFYPSREFNLLYNYKFSAHCMKVTNKRIRALRRSFSYPEKTSRIRGVSDAILGKIGKVPGFSIMMTPAVYVWTILTLVFFGIRKRNTACCALLILPLTIILMCVLGPCNGYYTRYQYPIIIIMPFLLPAFAHFLAGDSVRVSEVKAGSLAD